MTFIDYKNLLITKIASEVKINFSLLNNNQSRYSILFLVLAEDIILQISWIINNDIGNYIRLKLYIYKKIYWTLSKILKFIEN